MRNLLSTKALLLLSPLIILVACSKEEDKIEVPKGTLTLDVTYSVDGSPLLLDTLLYVDDVAGYAYKVTDVEYYLSDIKLIRSDSSEISVRNYQFMKAGRAGGSHFTISGIDTGSYCGISFNIGLTPLLNTFGKLPDIQDNQSMQWPAQYGNGYYFFRFSGGFGNPGDTSLLPFEMALGDNDNLVSYRFISSIHIGLQGASSGFDMNLNEWLKHPNDYDFNIYGPFSVGNPIAMGLLKVNGADALNLR